MRSWVPLLLAASLTGCAGQGTVATPNLLAPKLILAARDEGNYTVYVHAAFGDRAYDWLSVAIDNRTLANRTGAYSLELPLNGTSFFAAVTADAGDQLYEWRAHVDIVPGASTDHARIARVDDSNLWSEPRTYSLPFEQILDHPRSP